MAENENNQERFTSERELIAEKKLEHTNGDAKLFIEDIIVQLPSGLGLAISLNELKGRKDWPEDSTDIVSEFQERIPEILTDLKIAKKLFESGRLNPVLGFNAESTQDLIEFYTNNRQLQSEEEIKKFIADLWDKIKSLNKQ